MWTSAWSSTGSGVPCSLCTASLWAPTSSLQSECPSAGSALSAVHEVAGCWDALSQARDGGRTGVLDERTLSCMDMKSCPECFLSEQLWKRAMGHTQGDMQKEMGRWANNPSQGLGPLPSYPVMCPAQPGPGVNSAYLLPSSFSLGLYPHSRHRTESEFPRNSPRKVPGATVGLLLPNSILSSLPTP